MGTVLVTVASYQVEKLLKIMGDGDKHEIIPTFQ